MDVDSQPVEEEHRIIPRVDPSAVDTLPTDLPADFAMKMPPTPEDVAETPTLSELDRRILELQYSGCTRFYRIKKPHCLFQSSVCLHLGKDCKAMLPDSNNLEILCRTRLFKTIYCQSLSAMYPSPGLQEKAMTTPHDVIVLED